MMFGNNNKNKNDYSVMVNSAVTGRSFCELTRNDLGGISRIWQLSDQVFRQLENRAGKVLEG